MVLGYSIGLRALLASQQSMDIIGQNIANMATEGYSRRSVVLGPTTPLAVVGLGSLGTGVQVADVRRVHDDLLERRLTLQRQDLGAAQAEAGLLRVLNGAFQELGDTGLRAQLDDFFAELSSLSAAPTDGALRDGLLFSATTLAGSFQQTAGQIQSVKEEAREQVWAAVDQINGLVEELADLNRQVLRAAAVGGAPGELLDAQDRLVQDLSEWVDVQTLRREPGTLDVLIDGLLVLSGDHTSRIEATQDSSGRVSVVREEDGSQLAVRSGRLRGLLNLVEETVPEQLAELNAIAHQLILEMNRAHTTGVAGSGPYRSLVGATAVEKHQAGGQVLPLSAIEFDFPPQAGRLTVNVVRASDGSVAQHAIDVDPDSMSLDDLAAALSAIPNLMARVDASGRLHVNAASGYGFDFSARLDVDPDDAAVFGSSSATLHGAAGPYSLTAGDTLSVDVDGTGPQLVTFQAADFANLATATAEEVAAVFNNNLTGATALVVDGAVVLRSSTNGPSSQLLVADVVGTPSAALGLSTSLEQGGDHAVKVTLSGERPADLAGTLTVRASGDGTIGSTPGLTVEVVNEAGLVLATLDVGQGYAPGEPLEVRPGLHLSFTVGDLSASAGDRFQFDLIEDSDESDVLVTLGLGTLFEGKDATDIEVAGRLLDDALLLAGSASGEPGDGGNFLRMLEVQGHALSALSGRTLGQSYADLVASIGRQTSGAEAAEKAQELLMSSMEARREEISGVNVDEEMLRLVEMQNLYTAAARYLQSVSQIQDVLYNLL